MAKSKEKKPHPKPPAGVASVEAIKKTVAERKEKLAQRKAAASKDGKLNKFDPKYRVALKRLKRSQRKLLSEAYRLKKVKTAEAAPAAPAEGAAPAGEKKE